MLNVSLLQFYFLNSNESLFYILIKVIINHLTQVTQRINIKLLIINFQNKYCIFWTSIYVGGGKKKFMTITLKFYIIVNKIYLYNYSDKIKVW